MKLDEIVYQKINLDDTVLGTDYTINDRYPIFPPNENPADAFDIKIQATTESKILFGENPIRFKYDKRINN